MDKVRIAKELVRMSKELIAKEQVSEKDLEKLAELTDQNEHTRSLIYLFENVLKEKKEVEALKAIEELHNYFGNMPSELSKLRSIFLKKGMELAKRKFSVEDYNKIYQSF